MLAGCGQNSPLFSQNKTLLGQQPALASRSEQLQSRASALDQDNVELESLLAQSRQRIQLLDDELKLVREQLGETTESLTQARNDNAELEGRTRAMTASARRRGSATIRPNNSLTDQLTAVRLSGVEVRQDGDVIRVELPGEKLFHPGSAQLKPGAATLLESVMSDLMASYPRQIIGVEGHTDDGSIRTADFPSDKHLSIARATAVYEHLTGPLRVLPSQLFVLGHGANHPVVSNATPAGKTRNRRVELVIYPEKAAIGR
jgi:flagellar motor protein MotB